LKKSSEYQLLRVDLLASRLHEGLNEAVLVEKAADPEIESIVENELVLEDEDLLLEDLLDDFEDFGLEGWIVDRVENFNAKRSLEELCKLLEALADASCLWLGILICWALFRAARAPDEIRHLVGIGVACRIGSHEECSEKVEHEGDVLELERLGSLPRLLSHTLRWQRAVHEVLQDVLEAALGQELLCPVSSERHLLLLGVSNL
jgi:hypothetical protein